MSQRHICAICQCDYSRRHDLKRHLLEKHPETILEPPQPTPPSQIECSICGKIFSRKFALTRHLEHQHPALGPRVPELVSRIHQLESDLKSMETKVEHLNSIPPSKILQIFCLGSEDNLLEKLTDCLGGDFHKAIDYLKDCALSEVSGDCQLIEKIYHTNTALFSDLRKNIVYYYNDRQVPVSESRESMGHKIASNLQNGYLRGVNHLIRQGERSATPRGAEPPFTTQEGTGVALCPPSGSGEGQSPTWDTVPPLDVHDLMTWNQHIYHLSDINYQRKLMNQLHLSPWRNNTT